MSITNFFAQGGFAMYPLLLCSILTVAVLLERFHFLWGVEQQLRSLRLSLIDPLEQGDRQRMLTVTRTAQAPLAPIFVKALTATQKSSRQIETLVGQGRDEVLIALKRYLWILGTIGASAPFIGLLGTVLGIIRSFHSMATAGTGGFDVVAAGISEALIATAAGLVVAIVAVISYNYFTIRVNRIALLCRDLTQQFLLLFTESSP